MRCRAAGLLALIAAACGERRVDAPPPLPESPALQRAAPEDVPSTQPAQHSELIVGSERGLEAWPLRGGQPRSISPGAALHPRWLDAGNVLVLRPANGGDIARGAVLERVALSDGKRTQVAVLPPSECSGGAHALDLQDPRDFVVDSSARTVCLQLMDRNANMADVAVFTRISLDSGKVQRWLTAGEESCQLSDLASEALVECQAENEPLPDPDPDAFPHTFEDERVEGPKRAQKLSEYELEQVSPTGRWLVLGGDYQDADYIQRKLVLLDRARGELYAVPSAMGPWPSALRGSRVRVPAEGTADVVGESDVRWLAFASTELLVVDQLVLVPGERVFAIDGTIAK